MNVASQKGFDSISPLSPLNNNQQTVFRPAVTHYENTNAEEEQQKKQQKWGPPEVAPSEVEKIAVLGDGSFGTVFVGRCRSKDVAVKVLHCQDLDEKTRAAFRQEVEIMSKIFHPNIILFMGACTVPGNYMIITELMPRGDLDSLLRNNKIQLSPLMRMKMAKDAALGMTWLHGSNPQFIHRDLKTSNLLVDEKGGIKICDFGLSQIKKKGENLFDGLDGAKGTPLSMAPEVMCGLEFNEKCDVYSFGIVLWEILTKEEPYQEFETFEEFRNAVCFQHARPPIPQNCHPSLRKLIECCWDPNPQKRPSFPVIVQALEHIIVEYAILDEIGKRLWKERFLKRESILWHQILSSILDLLDYYGDTTYQLLPDNYPVSELSKCSFYQLREFATRSPINAMLVEKEYSRRSQNGVSDAARYYDDLKLICLKTLLVEKGREEEEMVTMEGFGNMLIWFGPIVDMNTRKVVLLDNVFDILSTEWFHGDVSLEEAENRLEKRPYGTFLVRYSSIVGCYTVSKVCRENRVTHQRIIRNSGRGYSINNVCYPSLVELIAQSKNELDLLYPCPGSRYINSIFKPSSSVYVYVQHNFIDESNKNTKDGGEAMNID